MKVLLIGSGAREHALATSLLASPQLAQLVVSPGNAGTRLIADARLSHWQIDAADVTALVDAARQERPDLVVVGPEIPLAAGIADRLQALGIACFGPSQAAAKIEASKLFGKQLMAWLGIPSAGFATFTEFDRAAAYIANLRRPFVIKVSGLAAGKGVFLPESNEEGIGLVWKLLNDGLLGEAGKTILVEERLTGEEFSLMAFCDGRHIAVMPSAQDHKKIGDGDEGPNTGGMGAYAPTAICDEGQGEALAAKVIAPVVAELAQRGTPFVGVIYAGMMLTPEGPRVLEFNARFGDPEAQAVLALLQSDLLPLLVACTNGSLGETKVSWRRGAAATVVMASAGYPLEPKGGVAISIKRACPGVSVFHAATTLVPANGGEWLRAGAGRVLAVTAYADKLRSALDAVYAQVAAISFEGAQFRRDIGARGLSYLANSRYAAAGVDIDAGNHAVALMAAAVKSTYNPSVLGGIGSFGGLFDAAALQQMRAPVLVSSIDGVGTKVRLASQYAQRHGADLGSIGADIVNHCIDDILVQGARPLFFLDYFAVSTLQPQQVAQVVAGMAAACRDNGVVLIGGETAEMPGVYAAGEFDIAGCIVGVVERDAILPRQDMVAGDLLIGLPSRSPHTNGYSLIRQVFADTPLNHRYPELDGELGEVLLRPHYAYFRELYPVLEGGLIKGMAHITGGGFIENIPRVLPPHLQAAIDLDSWVMPPLYPLIQDKGGVGEHEMYRVFNMGIGMVLVVGQQDAPELQRRLAEGGRSAWVIGRLQDSDGQAAVRLLRRGMAI